MQPELAERPFRASQAIRLAAFLAVAGATLTGWISPPIALALGLAFALALGNPMPEASHRASKLLLQWSVVGLGFGMDLAAVWAAGRTGFGLGRLLKVEATTSHLVSVGTAICGGSVIAAVGSVLDADSKAMSVALCTGHSWSDPGLTRIRENKLATTRFSPTP